MSKRKFCKLADVPRGSRVEIIVGAVGCPDGMRSGRIYTIGAIANDLTGHRYGYTDAGEREVLHPSLPVYVIKEKFTDPGGITYTVEGADTVSAALNPRWALVTMETEMDGQVRQIIVRRHQNVKVKLAAAKRAGLDPAAHIEVYANELNATAPTGMTATPWAIIPIEIASMLNRRASWIIMPREIAQMLDRRAMQAGK